jgi:hypothetical protein
LETVRKRWGNSDLYCSLNGLIDTCCDLIYTYEVNYRWVTFQNPGKRNRCYSRTPWSWYSRVNTEDVLGGQ